MSIATQMFWAGEITNYCSCQTYNEDTDTSTDSAECFGCFEESAKDIQDNVIAEWLKINDYEDDQNFIIVGENVGWQRLVAYGQATADNLLKALSINSGYTLRVYLDPTKKVLTITRSSHDEMGAKFSFTPTTLCEGCDEQVPNDKIVRNAYGMNYETECWNCYDPTE